VARGRVAALEMVIPNSKLVINPGAAPDEWRKELYLRPGQWIPWVGATVLGTMVALAGVVLVLHLNEKVGLFHLCFRLIEFLLITTRCSFCLFILVPLGFSGRTSWRGGGHPITSILTHYNNVYIYSLVVYPWRAIVR